MSFEVSRLRRADWIVGGGSVALFVFVFLFKWFGASASASLPGGTSYKFSSSANAWHTLSNTRWLLLLTIVVGLGFVALVAQARTVKSPVAPSAIVAGLGLLSAIFVLYRIFDHPSGSGSIGVGSFSYGAKIGLYLGFVACLAVLYGGYLKMQEEGTSLSDVREQAERAVGGFGEGSGSSGGQVSDTGSSAPAPPAAPPADSAPPPASSPSGFESPSPSSTPPAAPPAAPASPEPPLPPSGAGDF